MASENRSLNGDISGEAVTPNKLLTAENTSVKLKKYTFIKETRMLLLQSVREFDAHLAALGEKDKLFAQIHQRFIENLPSSALLRQQRPSLKTLRDKLRSMLTTLESQNGKNIAASGITEIVTEEDQLLDDFLLEINEVNFERKKKGCVEPSYEEFGCCW